MNVYEFEYDGETIIRRAEDLSQLLDYIDSLEAEKARRQADEARRIQEIARAANYNVNLIDENVPEENKPEKAV